MTRVRWKSLQGIVFLVLRAEEAFRGSFLPPRAYKGLYRVEVLMSTIVVSNVRPTRYQSYREYHKSSAVWLTAIG